jgi:hypothetical protein
MQSDKEFRKKKNVSKYKIFISYHQDFTSPSILALYSIGRWTGFGGLPRQY